MTPGTCWAEVDLAALRGNLGLVRSLAPGAPVLAIVKADAYGHGAVPVSRALAAEGVDALGVATVAEGRELRTAGLAVPVVVLGRSLPEEYGEALRWGLEITLPDPRPAERLAALARGLGVTARVHLKVDTGMNRLGVPWEQGAAAARAIASLPGLALAGVFSHYSSADEEDPAFTALQTERFTRVMTEAAALGVDAPFHLLNSAAALTGVRPPGAGVRPGIILYGCLPAARLDLPGLLPVLSWKARVLQVREVPAGSPVSYSRTFTTRRPSRIAVAGVGYADGLPRSLSNRARLLVRGLRAPVAGRVCMDMTMLDVTEIDGVEAGDEVVIIGSQSGPGGEGRVTAGELADLAGTICYEILCGISPRVPRVYLSGEGA